MKIDVGRVGHELQETLVELVDLALQAKQAHWNVHGPSFKSLHEQLDELTADVRVAMDDVAERAVAIGYPPDGRAGTVAKSSPLHDFPEGAVRDQEVIALIVERLAGLAERLRSQVDTLQDLDPASQDLLIGILRTVDKHHWMFAARAA
jgi:starvation-inducible DNA-binding protein